MTANHTKDRIQNM